LPNENNINEVVEHFKQTTINGDVAAFIYEPLLLGAGGMKIYKPEHLEILLQLATSANVLNIADEVMTGFGRTGKMFASEYMITKPDLICLSKGLSGGILPMGITTCNSKVYSSFEQTDKTKTFYHGHSFTGNPITCAAAIASLDLFDINNILEKIQDINNLHIAFVQSLSKYKQYCRAETIGVILRIEFINNENTSYLNNIKDVINEFFIERKIIVRPLGNIFYLLPPYCIEKTDLEYIYKTIVEFIQTISSNCK